MNSYWSHQPRFSRSKRVQTCPRLRSRDPTVFDAGGAIRTSQLKIRGSPEEQRRTKSPKGTLDRRHHKFSPALRGSL